MTGGRFFLRRCHFSTCMSSQLSVTSDQLDLVPPPPTLNSSPPSPHGSTQQYHHPLKEGEAKRTDTSAVICGCSCRRFGQLNRCEGMAPCPVVVIGIQRCSCKKTTAQAVDTQRQGRRSHSCGRGCHKT